MTCPSALRSTWRAAPGRHTRYLAELGHRVIGVDSAQAMLDRAAANVPDACLSQADLRQLPIPDHAVDVIVCALALTHVPDLGAALTEFVRVLRPGGHLVISDSRGLFGYLGAPVPVRASNAEPGVLPHWNRLTSDYLAAALPLGLQVRRCVEPRRPAPLIDPDAAPAIEDLRRATAEHLGSPHLLLSSDQRRLPRQPGRHRLAFPTRAMTAAATTVMAAGVDRYASL